MVLWVPNQKPVLILLHKAHFFVQKFKHGVLDRDLLLVKDFVQVLRQLFAFDEFLDFRFQKNDFGGDSEQHEILLSRDAIGQIDFEFGEQSLDFFALELESVCRERNLEVVFVAFNLYF